MKKIIALIITLACIFTMFACGDNNNGGNNNGNQNSNGIGSATVATFNSAILNSKPTFVGVSTSVTTTLGDLGAEYNISYSADGSATIEYSYEKFNRLQQGEDTQIKSVYEGIVVRTADGVVTGDVDNAPSDLSSITAGTSLALANLPAEGVTISETGNTLTASVPTEASESVFGMEISETVTLIVTIANGNVDSVRISGESMNIEITYKYN